MYIYHIFLIQSTVDGHLGCLHVLAVVNSATMSIVHSFLLISDVIFFFFGLFRATPTADGISQARGGIRAVAAGLCHSHSNACL